MRSVWRRSLTLMLCGSLLLSPMAVNADTATTYIDIDSKEDLDGMRDNLSGQYRLTADIVFTTADFAEGGAFYNNGAGWAVIGSGYSTRFTGELNGNGHTITGLTATQTAESGSVYAGLFGYSSGSVRDLTMKDTTISVTGGDHVYAGAVVAAGMGSIQDVVVENCQITIRDMAVTGKAGGIAGRMFSGTVSRVSATGKIDVAGVSPSVGGIVGQSHAAIEQAYSQVNVIVDSRGDAYAGGITGTNEDAVTTSVATGSLQATSASDGNVGGIVGWNQKTVSACLATGTQTRAVSHYDNFGGVIGSNDGAVSASYYLDTSCANSPAMTGVTLLTAAQAANKDSFTNWNFDTDWAIGYMDDVDHPLPQSAVRPLLQAELADLLVTVTEPERYTVASLQALRTAQNNARSLTNESPLSAYEAAKAALRTANTGLTEKQLSVAVTGDGDVAITGTNAYGQAVQLAATPKNGQIFSGFVLHGVLYPAETIDTVVSGAENAAAYFRSDATCTVVFRGKYGRVLSVQTVSSADEITSPDAPVLRGYTFMGWNADLTQLDLSEGFVSVDAVYAIDDTEDGCTVTLIDAVADRAMDEPLPFDACVQLTPAEKEGQVFSHWLVNGAVASTDPTYTLFVAGDDTVQAVYDSQKATPPSASVQHTYYAATADGKHTLNVIGQIYLPKDATVVEYGTLFAADSRCATDESLLTLNSMDCDTLSIPSSSVQPNRRYLTYLTGVKAGAIRYLRSYLVFIDTAGNRQIVYSPVTTVVIPSVS